MQARDALRAVHLVSAQQYQPSLSSGFSSSRWGLRSTCSGGDPHRPPTPYTRLWSQWHREARRSRVVVCDEVYNECL